ncbi:MAG: VTT domain-containing protein [Myxococcales bacterium]|nr:VTT domain-containing protein [Myxococcales bacterium]
MLSFALLQPFIVPGTVFLLGAPLIWPWHIAFALTMTGTMAASVIGFLFARIVARDLLAPRIPAKLRRFDDALERRGFKTVLFIRFALGMAPPIHAFFGTSKVPFSVHFWGSLLGYAPVLLGFALLGDKLVFFLLSVPWPVWVSLVGVVLVGVVLWQLRRRAR